MYSVSKIAEITGGRVLPENAPDAPVNDILIDSRRLIRPDGTLFVAIVTNRNDGHLFKEELFAKGVRLFLVSREPNSNGEIAKWRNSENSDDAKPFDLATFIIVPDTLVALQKLAAYHRSLFSYPVIAITGSNGKTIVKEWLYQLLGPDFNVIRSPKSYNSQIGVPLSVWKMEKENGLAIFEAGISRPGEMEKLEEIIKPDFGIITNIGQAHNEHFASAIQKTDEKLRLFKHAKLVVYCSDHELIDRCVKYCDPNRTFTPFSWSRSKPADLVIREVTRSAVKTDITAVYKEEELKFSIPFTDEASIENAIHCFAMGLVLGGWGLGIGDWGLGVRDSGLGIRDWGLGVRDWGLGVRDSGLGVRDSGLGIGGLGSGIRDSGLGIGGLESGLNETGEKKPGQDDSEGGPQHQNPGLKIRAFQERFSTLAPIAMRLELKDAINHCSLINDSYNSDINSLGIALDFLNQQNQHRKKTVILSDILQSGRDKNDLYTEIAALLESKGITKLIGIGRDMNKYSPKFAMQKNLYYTTDDFLMHYPVSSFQDESILLKGARLFEFERISNALQQKAHETVLEINLDAMVHNLNHYRSLLKPGVKLMAMVKAFSYGSGSFEIANLLQFHRADYLAVAFADEGVELRRAGIRLPIMVMSPEEQSLDTLLKYNLEPEIYNLHILELLEEAVKRNQTSNQEAVRVHIKLDTGMHRLGFQEDEMDELIMKITGTNGGDEKMQAESLNKAITVVSIFSHLAASEDPAEDEFTREQIRLFDAMSSRLISAIGYQVPRHILNSAGISRFPDAQFDMVRLGIGLYGVGVNDEESRKLRNVSTLRTIVIQLKQIRKDETIGYGRKGKAMADSLIAVIPVGYADGLNRRLGNGTGKVYIGGDPAPITGNICMDLTMVDVTGMNVKVGDEVEIFSDSHPVTELAEAVGTIPYEVMTGISGRVKRIYYYE